MRNFWARINPKPPARVGIKNAHQFLPYRAISLTAFLTVLCGDVATFCKNATAIVC